MAKRFVDTLLHRKAWFRRLPPRLKCAWYFIIAESSCVGVWSIDIDAMTFHVGEQVSLEEFVNSFTSDKPNRIMKLDEEKLFIPGFVSYQNTNLSIACLPHKPIIIELQKLLINYPSLSLCEALPKGFQTLKEIEKEIEIGKEMEKLKLLEKGKRKKKETEQQRIKREVREAFKQGLGDK